VVRGCIIIYHYLLRTANYLISFQLKQFAAASSVDTSTGAKEKECVSAGGWEGAGKLTRPHDVASLRLHHKRESSHNSLIRDSQGTRQVIDTVGEIAFLNVTKMCYLLMNMHTS